MSPVSQYSLITKQEYLYSAFKSSQNVALLFYTDGKILKIKVKLLDPKCQINGQIWN